MQNPEMEGQHTGNMESEYLPQLQAELESIDVSFTSAKKLLETGKIHI